MNGEEKSWQELIQTKAVKLIQELDDELYDCLMKHGASKDVIEDVYNIILKHSFKVDEEIL